MYDTVNPLYFDGCEEQRFYPIHKKVMDIQFVFWYFEFYFPQPIMLGRSDVLEEEYVFLQGTCLLASTLKF